MSTLPRHDIEAAWSLAIRRMHWLLKWPDHRIAEALSYLTPEDIAEIEEQWQWDDVALDALMTDRDPHFTWTRDEVRRLRRKFKLPGRPGPPINEQMALRSMSIAAQLGWGGLVGRAEQMRELWDTYGEADKIAAAVGWPESAVMGWRESPWDSLPLKDSLILAILNRYGPLTRSQIREAAPRFKESVRCIDLPEWVVEGLNPNTTKGKLPFRRLYHRGLIEVADGRSRRRCGMRPRIVLLARGLRPGPSWC